MVSHGNALQFAEFGCPKLALTPSNLATITSSSSSPGSMRRTTTMTNSGAGDHKKVQRCCTAGRKLVEKTKSAGERKRRLRSLKTREEVQRQRMTHIAVERNRRRQMNEHLRVLRSLIPMSYVQRGDQASIVGGAIEFVRELQQLLQCLESQKRRRLLGSGSGDASISSAPQPSFYPPDLPAIFPFPSSGGVLEEMAAENKSCVADVKVRLLGLDAAIKILSRRRGPGQLLRTIQALENLHFFILHTNITTVAQTVLYSFSVRIASEAACTAEEIASSVQQMFSSNVDD